MVTYDYIIVGSGIAGLYTALLASRFGSVIIVTKGSIEECNTRFAQGGIAAAIGAGDSPELHFEDTMKAGAGLCDAYAVRILVDEAAEGIKSLIELGVPFDTVEGEVALTLEAAHSMPRILHAGGDATGRHIEETLSSQVRASGIPIVEHCLVSSIAVDRGRVCGVKTITGDGEKHFYSCRNLILASGGAGQLYSLTTNPDIATGDGVALAYRAGADIQDMEFFQFHPTALKITGAPPFLISESVRGEGGILRDGNGRRFMPDYSDQAELAPRDVVSRAIVSEMTRGGTDHVLLDVTHLPAALVLARFPQIYRHCLAQGLDITRNLIPVAPAAHYMVGGIRVDEWGASSLPGLYAAGEVACTGVHGANRLASNSLLEVLVFARRIVTHTNSGQPAKHGLSPIRRLRLADIETHKVLSLPDKAEFQSLMWHNAGILREESALKETARKLAGWEAATIKHVPDSRKGWELANLILAGRLLVEAALNRRESRGAHFRTDYPEPDEDWRRHVVFNVT